MIKSLKSIVLAGLVGLSAYTSQAETNSIVQTNKINKAAEIYNLLSRANSTNEIASTAINLTNQDGIVSNIYHVTINKSAKELRIESTIPHQQINAFTDVYPYGTLDSYTRSTNTGTRYFQDGRKEDLFNPKDTIITDKTREEYESLTGKVLDLLTARSKK